MIDETQAEIYRLVKSNLADGDVELIEGSKDQSEYWHNMFRVLVVQRKRELTQVFMAFELVKLRRDSKLKSVVDGPIGQTSQRLRDYEQSDDALGYNESKTMIAGGFRWFAGLGIEGCYEAAELVELESDWQEIKAAGVNALASIQRWVDGQERADFEDRTEQGSIPPSKMTKPLSKKKAARLLGRHGDENRAVEWLTKCIENGIVRREYRSRQSGVYHIDDFPADVHDKILPS